MPDESGSNWQQLTADPMTNTEQQYTGEDLAEYEGYANIEEEGEEEQEEIQDPQIAYTDTNGGYTCAHPGCSHTKVYKRKCDLE